MSGKGIRKIIKIEIARLKTISIIARLYRQFHKNIEVSKVNNIEKEIVGAKKGPLIIFGDAHYQFNKKEL